MTEKEIIKVEAKQSGLAVLGDIEEMTLQMQAQSERLALAHQFIETNFVAGIDYGLADPRTDKPTLLKPGAEKVCKLFNTHPTWHRDLDTWEMMGSTPGIACYICEIVHNITGLVVGEGRGAGTIKDAGRDANKTIKIAEKRAIVDAALYTFGLSERFTQDGGAQKVSLEDKKRVFSREVAELRGGIESELSDNAWIITVLEKNNHMKHIPTEGALNRIRKAIFDKKMFDLSTGEFVKKPEKNKEYTPEGVEIPDHVGR